MNKQKWMILGGAGIVLLVAGGITAAVLLFPYSSNQPKILSEEEIRTQDPLATAQYMATEEFGKLPKDEKQKYLDVVMSDQNKRREMFATRDKLSDTERQQLRKNMGSVFRDHMKKQVDEYCKLPPDQREEYLDKIIDQMEEMRKNRPPRDSTGRAGNRSGRPREPRGDRMKQRLEGSTPTERAQRTQFFMDMRARMKARGIEPRHRGHR